MNVARDRQGRRDRREKFIQ